MSKVIGKPDKNTRSAPGEIRSGESRAVDALAIQSTVHNRAAHHQLQQPGLTTPATGRSKLDQLDRSKTMAVPVCRTSLDMRTTKVAFDAGSELAPLMYTLMKQAFLQGLSLEYATEMAVSELSADFPEDEVQAALQAFAQPGRYHIGEEGGYFKADPAHGDQEHTIIYTAHNKTFYEMPDKS